MSAALASSPIVATAACLSSHVHVRDAREAPTHLYRYTDSEDADEGGLHARSIHLMRYRVIKATRKGVWIETGYRKRKFVLLEGSRRYAYPTLDGARRSYRRRKQMQRWHAGRTAMQAAFGLAVADECFPQSFDVDHRVAFADLPEGAA